MIDSFDGGEFSSLDPVCQFPRSSTFIHYLLNFVIEEGLFGVFD